MAPFCASLKGRGDVGTSSRSAERLGTAGTHDRHASIWEIFISLEPDEQELAARPTRLETGTAGKGLKFVANTLSLTV